MKVPDKEIYSTNDTLVVSSYDCQLDCSITPCNHEEADTRIILHAAHCARLGHQKVAIRTVDTDVLVLAVAAFQFLQLQELWIAFGTKHNLKYIPVHSIAETLGDEKSKALPMFHALTGCDSVSAFSHKGKKTALDTWTAYPAITNTFVRLSSAPQSIPDECVAELERFVVLLCSRSSDCSSVNETRK